MTEAEKERAAVVAWLRTDSQRCHRRAVELTDDGGHDQAGMFVSWSTAMAYAASRIERGDHLKDTGDPR